MGRETDRRHLLVKSQCFEQFWIRSAACKVMFPQQSLETTRCENIKERDSRWTTYSNPATCTMLNPRTPKSQCFSARVTKVMLGAWFVSSIRANALQVTLTLNLGGRGVVPDRRGLNISSIYGSSHFSPDFMVKSQLLMAENLQPICPSLNPQRTSKNYINGHFKNLILRYLPYHFKDHIIIRIMF